MSIEVKEITKFYGTQKALDNVTFNIHAGEIVGFLGPNGAGKTTMMKILTCFLPPSSGDAFVSGFNIFEAPEEIKKRIGYLPESNPLYHEMYVKEYLSFIAGIHKLGKSSKSRVSEIIEMTGLEKEQHKKIGALSKGYKQRVGLSQALIHNPEVLILDEPTSGLDPNQVVDIRKLIKNIGKDKTIMLSTHIMREVEAICDRVIIINQGKIAADKSINELQELTQQKQYVVTLELDKKIQKSLLMQIDHVKGAENVKDNLWRITIGSEKDIRSNLFKWAVNHDLTVLSMSKEEFSLEEAFHFLTKK
ncbi:MAG: gliding motility-associated ABC transporter ATP-binding subunit GldA [Bacteroidales bacterium]|nr:gliding motility-associated ABC transporter ATP-binding subunit GldA [Bacteroidales bacterium]